MPWLLRCAQLLALDSAIAQSEELAFLTSAVRSSCKVLLGIVHNILEVKKIQVQTSLFPPLFLLKLVILKLSSFIKSSFLNHTNRTDMMHQEGAVSTSPTQFDLQMVLDDVVKVWRQTTAGRIT